MARSAFLIVAITSSAATAGRAEAIRQTWLSAPLPSGVRAFFVVGAAPRRRLAGDTLHLPCGDDYEHLHEKVRGLLELVAERFPRALLFKCDDDTFVRVPELLSLASGIGSGFAGRVLSITSSAMERRARNWHMAKVRLRRLATPYTGALDVPWCDGGTGYFLAPEARDALLAHWPRADANVGEDVLVARGLARLGIAPQAIDGLCPFDPLDRGSEATLLAAGTASLHPVAGDDMGRLHAVARSLGGAARQP